MPGPLTQHGCETNAYIRQKVRPLPRGGFMTRYLDNLADPDRQSRACILLCSLAVGFHLLMELMALVCWPELKDMYPQLDSAKGALAIAMLLCGKAWRAPWMILLSLGYGWLLFVTWFNCGAEGMDAMERSFRRYQLVYLCLPAMGLFLSRKRIGTFLRFFIAAWTLFYVSMSVASLYSAVTGEMVMALDGMQKIYIHPTAKRLYMMNYYTTSASYLCIAVLLAALGIALTRNRVGKVAYALAIVPMLLALSLTDGQTAFITMGAAMGAGLGSLVVAALRRRQVKRPLRALAFVSLALVGAVGSFLLMPKLVPVVYSVPAAVQEASLVATAQAEEEVAEEDEEPVRAEHRADTSLGFLSGREYVWMATLDMLAYRPEVLLTGTSPVYVMGDVEAFLPEDAPMSGYAHTHSIYLQILASAGLPGLIIALLVLALFARAAWRLFFSDGLSAWERLVPVPALAIIAAETVECFTLLEVRSQTGAVLGLFIGLTCCLAARAVPAKKKAA